MKIIAAKNERTGELWFLYPQDFEKRALLAKKLNIPLPVAQVLINRGINSVEEGEMFLKPALSKLHSPFYLRDMHRAVEILRYSLRQGKKIAVYGDYDVDGITATALLYSLLQQLGGEVIFYIPDRLHEGYGLNSSSLDYLKSRGVSLIVTVDCGINAAEEVNYARKLGMDVLITDHHRPPAVLPAAAAVVNPLRTDCAYPFKDLCGVGIAFKLGQALLQADIYDNPGIIWDYLDLVALGTVADIVPLTGENRILVTHGLRQMERKLRPGLQALCNCAGLKKSSLTAEEIAFIIAPRLNAAGRLGDAARSLYLLLEEEQEQASRMALELHEENKRRQSLELKTFHEACDLIEEKREEAGQNFILLAREGWHHGILGIVAGRLVEKYNVPVILLALHNGLGKGSGRSSGDFDLTLALSKCSSLLLGFGGHRLASGLTVKEECINSLREKLDALAGEFYADKRPALSSYADVQLEPAEITPELVRALKMLEPFGPGNPQPLFYSTKWTLEKKREVGKGQQHLQLGLRKNARYFPGISFNGRSRLPQLELFREINLVFSVSFDQWRGNNSLQMEVLHCAHCDEYRGNCLTVVDVRGSERKWPYLQGLLGRDEGLLVFVNTVQRLENLRKKFAGRQKIYFSHQGDFSPDICPEVPRHLLLYDLPLREEKLKELLCSLLATKNGPGATYLHLLYSKRGFMENIKLLLATVPTYASLEQVCLALQKLAAGGSVPLNSICSALRSMLPFSATEYMLKKCLEILYAASYLEVNEQGLIFRYNSNDYCSLLKNIAAVEVYRQERNRWEKTLSWQQFLLEATGEEIVALLSDFINCHT